MSDYKTIRAQTQNVYKNHAEWYARHRGQGLGEDIWLDRFLAPLPAGGRVLDLGCGTGEPVAAHVLRRGFALTGLDYAPEMVALAQARFPDGNWQVGDIRAISEIGTFDGIYSWDGFFHLSRDEQRAAIPEIAARIRPGGAVMLTIGPRDGEVTGTIAGETVYHASLSHDEYETAFGKAGFATIVIESSGTDPEGRWIVLATGKV